MKNNRSSCPLVNILDILGDKWSLIIVRDIFHGKKSYGEFLASPENISTSVLASRLQLLERADLIKHRLSLSDKKVKFYYLTDRGIDLYPILYEMSYWSKRNLDKEFFPIAEQWFKRYKSINSIDAIKDNQKKYKKVRAELLELE
ncbi:MAG: helix-turn-helix domain-containing protein [Bacteroidota bacterium]|nr:helix-turn-helix domain-containing protein [Bacteroidota bacterium]MEC9135131.1 helix-turn-helix domain-containing protein [Bacteroidota bacterium]